MVYRGVAVKVRVGDILRARITREGDGIVVSLPDGRKCVRVNVIGTIVALETEQQNAVLDDGSGHIRVQFFETPPNISVGQLVMCIGRVREFGEPYLTGDIVKPIDAKWVMVRMEEIKSQKPVVHEPVKEDNAPVEESKDTGKVLDIIRGLDEGKGADEDAVIEKVGDKAEEHIRSLVRDGEVFYTAPGRLKVLD